MPVPVTELGPEPLVELLLIVADHALLDLDGQTRLNDETRQLLRNTAARLTEISKDVNETIPGLRAELQDARLALEPCARFVMWALTEGSWQGADIDGGAAQDKAVLLGLIVETTYDPKKHGENGDCDPGDQWFVGSETILAALQESKP